MNRKLLQTFKRVARDDSALEHSEKVQEKVLLEILKRNRNTFFAKEYSLDEIDSADAYMKRMPIAKYGDLKPYIAQMKAGIPHVLLAEDFPRWAETSGTLSSPKFYPFIAEIAEHFGQTLAKIILACIEEEPERAKILQGKMLMVVADVATRYIGGKPVGYISGIVSHDVQRVEGMDTVFTPPCEVLAMEDWESRWFEMARSASRENVTMTCSTPPILLSYFKKIVNEYSPALNLPDDITKIWPDLMLITGAGVRMDLYEKQYQRMLGDYVCCREFYCATEGFFAYQKDKKEGLIPILDHIFYEFIPLKEWEHVTHNGGDYRSYEFTRLTYAQVKCNEDYVLVLTTPAGLYSYVIGDIIRFVSPDRIVWVGRIGRESNVAGEKLNEMHMSMLRQSVESTLGVEITHQVAAVREDPLRYIFAFEFEEDVDIKEAIKAVDKSLRQVSPIYDDLRKKNVLKCPDIVALQKGAFDRYFQWKQKKEGSLPQVKPPLFANPEFIEELGG
ncbi:MAG: GH3 auxin-responsive promoter family protein [Theionarchaea archaeon]|nr:GH3 auxin-responsive promoter family protein [Theionarchaea archaeon]